MDMDDARRFIAGAKWQYAKTMPQWPHEYTLRKWNDEREFEDMIHYILHWGELRTSLHWKRIYLDVDEYYYWWMGSPIREAIIINRAKA
tara:strand:- start:3119 stop:3385 length:267 start_codon:yes stop_codon:yes gene_type:complete